MAVLPVAAMMSASSLPMRERGLKYQLMVETYKRRVVAPHAGAWIEMMLQQQSEICFDVAPHAGAWIEIMTSQCKCKNNQVAPHAGAWIEIETGRFHQPLLLSLPMRERGLK